MTAIPPYQVSNCAHWLVSNGKFRDHATAMVWLQHKERFDAFRYKAVLAAYFEATDYKQDYMDHRDVNKYRSSISNSYGEDSHMWWRM